MRAEDERQMKEYAQAHLEFEAHATKLSQKLYNRLEKLSAVYNFSFYFVNQEVAEVGSEEQFG